MYTDDDPYEMPIRIPKDAFEVALWREYIGHALSTFKTLPHGHLYTYMNDDPTLKGKFPLSFVWEERPFDPQQMEIPFVYGAAWLAEREFPASEGYRVVVMWEVFDSPIGPQTNYAPYPPVLDWTTIDRPYGSTKG
jgi:hypothetical protein